MNSDGDIHYNAFSDSELKEAYGGINAKRFPLNYQNLVAEIAARSHMSGLLMGSNAEQSGKIPKAHRRVTSDSLALGTLASVVALIYGAFGLYKNDVNLSTPRTGSWHLHDTEAKVFFVFVALVVITNFMRLHAWKKYGGTDNESYQTANNISLSLCFAFIVYCFISGFKFSIQIST